MEQLKVKEKIFFYEDLILYEDELADNGIAKLNVKMVNIEAFDLNTIIYTDLSYKLECFNCSLHSLVRY